MTSMPDVGPSPTVHDPIHHASYVFGREGANLWVHCWLEPGAHLPEHVHPTLEERWEVLDGTIQLKLDGHWPWLTVQDRPVRLAPDVAHEVRNPSGCPARARAKVRPAGHLEEFLTDAARAAREGVFTARGLPTSPRNAVWIAAFRAAPPSRDGHDLPAPGAAANRPTDPGPLRPLTPINTPTGRQP